MELPALTRDQVRSIDTAAIEEYGLPGIVLMENAGRGAAEIAARLAPSGPVTVLCGKGNNAGDGYVIARHLQLLGRDARVVSLSPIEQLSGDAKTNAEIARRADIEITVATTGPELSRSTATSGTLVDCLLGTGATGALRPPFDEAVRVANERLATRIAIDVPTGFDCDTGEVQSIAFRADHTISLVAPKVGFSQKNADTYVGVVHVVGIGVPAKLLRQFA